LACDLYFHKKKVGRGILDFLVEDKILVEIKRTNYTSPADFHQVNQYLKLHKLKLGILIRFTPDKVLFRRVLNNELPAANTAA
jgi:GxxExxY protein